MNYKAFEAHYSCGHFKPNNIKNGSLVKKLSPKDLGVSNEVWDTVYNVGVFQRGYFSWKSVDRETLNKISKKNRRILMFRQIVA